MYLMRFSAGNHIFELIYFYKFNSFNSREEYIFVVLIFHKHRIDDFIYHLHENHVPRKKT